MSIKTSSIKFRDPDGYASAFEWENSTTPMLKGVHTARLGLEYKWYLSLLFVQVITTVRRHLRKTL